MWAFPTPSRKLRLACFWQRPPIVGVFRAIRRQRGQPVERAEDRIPERENFGKRRPAKRNERLDARAYELSEGRAGAIALAARYQSQFIPTQSLELFANHSARRNAHLWRGGEGHWRPRRFASGGYSLRFKYCGVGYSLSPGDSRRSGTGWLPLGRGAENSFAGCGEKASRGTEAVKVCVSLHGLFRRIR